MGLPITALSPLTIIGRSINLGYLTIAFIHSNSDNFLPLKFFI
jgi:hypothetical protein